MFIFMDKYTSVVYCRTFMVKVPGLYWKVKVNGKWTWRKATFMIPPGEWDLVYNVLPFRSDE